MLPVLSIAFQGQTRLTNVSQRLMMNAKSADELVHALDSIGVHFVTDGEKTGSVPTLSSAELLASLATQSDARLRLAIVAVLLYRPDLARAVPEATTLLAEPALTTLKLFYTAAMLLQQKYARRLHNLLERYESIPDLFSEELGVAPAGDLEGRLKQLSEYHRAWSGLPINWVGTYEHAAERLIKRLEREAQWGTSPQPRS